MVKPSTPEAPPPLAPQPSAPPSPPLIPAQPPAKPEEALGQLVKPLCVATDESVTLRLSLTQSLNDDV